MTDLQILTDIKNEVAKKRYSATLEANKKQDYIKNQNSFNLFLQFHEKRSNNLYFEEIELEGFENAMMIMQSYRENGHQLKLKNLILSVNDDQETKVKKVNFKY